MSKTRNSAEYKSLLCEQIEFVQTSAQLYDQGMEAEAKRMAVAMRTLIHDTSISKSLLGQMHLKKKMSFLSMAQPYDSNNLLTQQCLLTMSATDAEGLRFNPMFYTQESARKLRLPEWRNEIVFSTQRGQTYKRRDVMLFLANREGGAHVDPELEDTVAALNDPMFTRWIYVDESKNEFEPNNNAVYATMRQMTFELLNSLYLVKPQLFKNRYF